MKPNYLVYIYVCSAIEKNDPELKIPRALFQCIPFLYVLQVLFKTTNNSIQGTRRIATTVLISNFLDEFCEPIV